MKRFLRTIATLFLSSLLFAAVASAETYLVAGLSSDAEGFIVAIDGKATDVPYQVVTIRARDGSVADWVLLGEVSTVTQGQHHVEIVPYKGEWQAASVPFDFTKPGISAHGLRTISGEIQ